ncbi:MAG: hypothetical protein WCW68_03710 [Methanothrix sp.]
MPKSERNFLMSLEAIASMEKMFCYVGDLLGFRNINFRLQQKAQSKRIRQLKRLVEDGIEEFSIPHHNLLSDTIFAGEKASIDGLTNILGFSQFMLEKGIEKALPLRGAVSFGDATFGDKNVHGKAIIQAYEHAEKQNWIGTSCTSWKGEPLKMLNEIWDFEKVFVYPVPMKEGKVIHLPAVSWKVPQFKDLRINTIIKGLVTKKYMDWNYDYKIQNTIMFSIYLKCINAGVINHRNPSKYPGDQPISHICSCIDEYVIETLLLRSGKKLHMEGGKKVFD